MMSLRVLGRPFSSTALIFKHGVRCASSQAKPKVLILDPINLAHDELESLKAEATLVVG
jgi:hypothetical protein